MVSGNISWVMNGVSECFVSLELPDNIKTIEILAGVYFGNRT